MKMELMWIVLLCFSVCPGTQRVISFLRQMVEHGGFYRTSDQAWVKFERIQFVGACNPPTDPGRKPLSHRCVDCHTGLLIFFAQELSSFNSELISISVSTH